MPLCTLKISRCICFRYRNLSGCNRSVGLLVFSYPFRYRLCALKKCLIVRLSAVVDLAEGNLLWNIIHSHKRSAFLTNSWSLGFLELFVKILLVFLVIVRYTKCYYRFLFSLDDGQLKNTRIMIQVLWANRGQIGGKSGSNRVQIRLAKSLAIADQTKNVAPIQLTRRRISFNVI